ncbi:MAG: general secretion pathway protein GspC [Polyangiaceae bacterium]|nr:general secretion pathway protein GspC [Polyangiaceae bacterium]
MAFDALLKRYFAAVVLVLIAVVAYFEAAGLTTLIGIPMMASTGSAVGAEKSAVGAKRSTPPKSRSAEAILARNPFDSVTGPLTPKPVEEEGRPQELDLSDPLNAPRCDDVELRIIAESPDPEWSLAALKGPGEERPTLRRVGDQVAGKQILYIGYNPRENSPAVWFSSDSALCQALMFAKAEAATPASGTGPSAADESADAAEAMGRRRRGPSKVPAEIASKIQKVSDTEFNVDRGVVDKILENQAELMRSARIVPEQQDGKVVGIRMFGVRPDTLLGTLGFQNGDRLESINGFNMASPEKALEAYARLRTASALNVKISRRGQPMAIDYHIK